MKLSRVVFLFAVLGSGTASAADSALTRIERAHREGRIDAAERALLGVKLVRAPETLPVEFRPEPGETLRCGTELLRRARGVAVSGGFSPQQHAEFLLGVSRPTGLNNTLVLDSSGTPIAVLHFSGTEPAGVAAFITQSWETEVNAMGWRAPLPDAGAGGADPDDLLDIYIDTVPGQGAFTYPEDDGPDTWNDATSFIVIDPAVMSVIETYISHELHHAIQFAYDYLDAENIYEASATFMEDKVFDSVDDYTVYVTDFQEEPALTLSYATYNSDYMYGAAVFLMWLSDTNDAGGTGLLEDVWDAMRASGTDSHEALDQVLTTEGYAGLADAYATFAGARFLTGPRDDGSIEEGENFEAVELLASYATLAAIEGGTTTTPPMGLGANYLSINPGDAEEGDNVTLTVEGEGAGPWGIVAIAIPESSDAVITEAIDDDADGTVELTVPSLDQLANVGFAVINLDVSEQPHRDASPDPATHSFSWSFGKGKDEPSACGCRIPGETRPLRAGPVVGMLLSCCALALLRRRQA